MNWDEVFDVVVVGSGIAGVSTALAAREAGLRPVLLEKADKLGGGTSFSMGGIWIGMNHLDACCRLLRTHATTFCPTCAFVGAEETDDERLLAYVDRGPEALKFFEDLGIRFRISRRAHRPLFRRGAGLRSRRAAVSTPTSSRRPILASGKTPFSFPRDTPIEVNSEELFNWGGIANINNWPKDVLEERRRNKIRTRGVGVITHFVKQLLARGVTIKRGTRALSLVTRTAASPAWSPTRAASRPRAG
jgi:3-oxosteroid 1-dehydrogenase